MTVTMRMCCANRRSFPWANASWKHSSRTFRGQVNIFRKRYDCQRIFFFLSAEIELFVLNKYWKSNFLWLSRWICHIILHSALASGIRRIWAISPTWSVLTHRWLIVTKPSKSSQHHTAIVFRTDSYPNNHLLLSLNPLIFCCCNLYVTQTMFFELINTDLLKTTRAEKDKRKCFGQYVSHWTLRDNFQNGANRNTKCTLYGQLSLNQSFTDLHFNVETRFSLEMQKNRLLSWRLVWTVNRSILTVSCSPSILIWSVPLARGK